LAGGKKASKPKEKIRHAKLRRKMLNGDSQKKDTDSLRKGLIATRAETLPFGKSGRRNNRRSARGLTEGFLLWDADRGRICDYCGTSIWISHGRCFHQILS
jgi:hypothetical protein